MIKLSKYFYNKCEEFANLQVQNSSRLYKHRGEPRVEKIIQDIIVGKLGEVAAYQYLIDRGYKVKKPDFEIYETRRKSYGADLVTDCGLNVHVKSQSQDSRKKYGSSWLFQKSDSLVKLPQDDDYILMVSVENLEADILGIVRAEDLLEVYAEPKVFRYKHTKRALYLDDIIDNDIDMEAL
jgi:hypothetical protein